MADCLAARIDRANNNAVIVVDMARERGRLVRPAADHVKPDASEGVAIAVDIGCDLRQDRKTGLRPDLGGTACRLSRLDGGHSLQRVVLRQHAIQSFIVATVLDRGLGPFGALEAVGMTALLIFAAIGASSG